MESDLEAYARVMAELAAACDAREVVLRRHGLDEAGWEALDGRWQARLSEAMTEDDDVPALLTTYAAAYAEAQRALAGPIPLEQFAQVTGLVRATGDLSKALARVGVTLTDYVRASEHWSRLIVSDPALERRFDAALRSR